MDNDKSYTERMHSLISIITKLDDYYNTVHEVKKTIAIYGAEEYLDEEFKWDYLIRKISLVEKLEINLKGVQRQIDLLNNSISSGKNHE